jgi:hypothetical protein
MVNEVQGLFTVECDPYRSDVRFYELRCRQMQEKIHAKSHSKKFSNFIASNSNPLTIGGNVSF